MTRIPLIKTKLPGKNGLKIVETDNSHLMTGTKFLPAVIKRGRGLWFEDVDGNTFLDFTSGMVTATGHCHPKVVAAIKRQASEFIYFNGPDFYYEAQASLGRRLCEMAPMTGRNKVFFSNSGAEAIEAAIKISRWSSRRKRFISFIGGFHGRTMGALALLGSKTVHRDRFFPMMPGVTHVPYAYCYRCAYKLKYPACDMWCAKILNEVYFKTIVPAEEVAALFIEPIQGEGGYVVPPAEFLQELRKITGRHGILLVSDEVQAGFGKTGRMFSIENFGVEPDLMALAKATGSGMPLGATVFRAGLDFSMQGAHSNTFGGNPICCAATLATLDVIEGEGLLDNAVRMGCRFKDRLLELQRDFECIGDVRGLGLMLATEFVEDRETRKPAPQLRDRVIEHAFKRGLLMLPCGTCSIRYSPALTVKKAEIDTAVSILGESIRDALDKRLQVKAVRR